MNKSLLVVESPTKVKTLSKFLGKDFLVKATVGHIKNLPKSKLGVDIKNDFEPQFLVMKGKAKVIDELKKAGKEADRVYIGTDPDREGEAIAFHVAEVIGTQKETERVLFNEITRKGVLDAMQHPVKLDEAKYNAQKSRRILDRLVGYKISPLLWEKVSYGLSAGRVQSVALRFICDREEEVETFVKDEYWVIDAVFQLPSCERFKATLEKKNGEKIKISSEEEAKKIRDELQDKEFVIERIEEKDKNVYPQPAFITSRLQQAASRRFRFSPKKTMMLAQKLYEGIDVGEEGPTGLITYMRTDSVRVSGEAIAAARYYIESTFSKNYLPEKPHYFKNRKSAQDAHEAIRPPLVHFTPDRVRPYLEKDLFLLYDLIWERFVASQMEQQRLRVKTIDIKANGFAFVARGLEVLFDGFTKIYEEEGEDESEDKTRLPEMNEGQKLFLAEILPEQRFTIPPPRYTEASLIRALETKGIGRPSTYATIVTTVQDRNYVGKDKMKLFPTPLGRTINKLLKEFFPLALDVGFTAKMEEILDLIEEDKKNWVKQLGKFNIAFEKELHSAKEGMVSLKKEEQETGIVCDRCGKKMLKRWSKAGEYLVCSGKLECKNKKNIRVEEDGTLKIIENEIKGTCNKCGGNLVVKSGKFGRFFACSNYPVCKYTEPYSLEFACPEERCTGKLVEKISKKKRQFTACSRYPGCTFATNREPAKGPCPSCDAPTLFTYRNRPLCLRKGCGWKSK